MMVDSLRTAGFVAIACGSPSPALPADREPTPTLQVAIASADVSEPLRGFPGRYTFAGGTAERDKLREAVDAVVAEMNPLVRGIARSRLLDSNTVAGEIAIQADGDTVTIAFDDRSYTAVLGDSAVQVTGREGDKLALTHRLQGKRLVQVFDGDKGRRRNTIAVRSGKLTLGVTVHSDSLPADLVYTLTFTRK